MTKDGETMRINELTPKQVYCIYMSLDIINQLFIGGVLTENASFDRKTFEEMLETFEELHKTGKTVKQ